MIFGTIIAHSIRAEFIAGLIDYMKKILLILSILFSFLLTKAQPGRLNLSGLVMKERKSVEGAIVRVYENKALVDSSFSKKGGKFFISLPLNKKFLIQFYHKGYSPKSISIETAVVSGMESMDFDKYMVIALDDIKLEDLKKELQPVAQFKFDSNGEMRDAGLQYQTVPNIIPNKDLNTILPNKIDASIEAQRILNAAKRRVAAMQKRANQTLDSARKQAYKIVYDAETVARQNQTTAKPKTVYVYDTVYVEKATKEDLQKVKAITKKKVSDLQKKQEELALRKKNLEIERLNAKNIRDSIKLAEIDNMIKTAEEAILGLTVDIENAQEKIKMKDLEIQARELQNRNLRLTVLLISSLAALILIFFVITYRNYKAKRRLAEELRQKNIELVKLSTIVSETDNAVVLFDLSGNLEWINKGFTRLYGFEEKDLEREKLDNVFLRKDRETSALHFEAVLDSAIQVSFESSTKNKDGNVVWVQSTMTPILDSEGKVHKIAAIDSNITQLKKAESEIKLQKEKLELHNRMIQDSIKYAHTIQAAFLPTDADLNSAFSSFLINKPKDIVSGDFVWFSDQVINGRRLTFVAAVDCTGHGVPGAFMSMIGNRLLTEIVTTMQIHEPDKILDKLNLEVQSALKQDTTENTDGMDVCLCRIEYIDDHCEVRFAGAQRPLLYYVAETNEIKKIKGDIKTAGGFLSSFIDKNFTSHTVKAQKGDMFYLTSDGIFDQNGPDRRRFGSKRVNAIIKEHATNSLTKQKSIFLNSLSEYQGDAEQRDDITLLGIRI